DPDLLHDGLKVFRKYSWRTRYQVVVKDAESAILYINFLYGIGLSAEQMRLTVLHGQKADESVVDSSLTFWKERINISAFRWGTAASTDGVSMGKQKALSVFSPIGAENQFFTATVNTPPLQGRSIRDYLLTQNSEEDLKALFRWINSMAC